MSEEENNLNLNNVFKTPLYERPGRLDPDRNVPITRQDRVDVNIHYDSEQKTFVKDSDSAEFTEQSVNAMDPFEDSALLSGDIKPKVVGIRTGAPKYESKIFVPEIDTGVAGRKIRTPVINEPEQPVYVAEEDAAASSDFIADAMSGVETAEKVQARTSSASANEPSVTRLKMYALLLGVVVVLEIAGIAVLAVI